MVGGGGIRGGLSQSFYCLRWFYNIRGLWRYVWPNTGIRIQLMENETPLIKFHTLEDPDPPVSELTPKELAEETNPENEA